MSASIATAFDAAQRREGAKNLAPDDLVTRFPPLPPPPATPVALDACRFYDDFATTPDVANKKLKRDVQDAIAAHGKEYVNEILRSRAHHPLRRQRRFDFRLTPEESARLERLGFVVSERLRAESFAEVYYRLYSDDMPVYITSDSVLHAWHRSFDVFLMDLEEQELVPLLTTILDDVCAAVTRSSVALGAVADDVAAYFAVTQHLLHGDETPTAATAPILKAIEKEERTTIRVFGADRDVDASQFKPRGHYTKAPVLERFFRAMTWLGTIDFRVDGTENPTGERHQLQCACLVVQLLRDANVLDRVAAFYSVISAITGDGVGADSMTPMQLHDLLGDRDIAADYLSPDSDAKLRELQDEIANKGLGMQAIAGHPLVESAVAAASVSAPTRLPTSFAFLGQQFVWSAFVFSKLVFDQVLERNAKVARRMPSAVDVAFALFGNNAAGQEMTKRMTASPKLTDDFVPHRDGLPYTANAVAVRTVVDEHLANVDPSDCSLALLWQLALRELSAPSASDARVFQSIEWQKRQMNTQIASLAQLRHDTILYAKQSFTMGTRCEYAAGFVDPYPAFWRTMEQLAERARTLVARLQVLNQEEDESELQYKARVFFETFADVMRKLGDIALAQASKQPLNHDQDAFLKSVMEERRGSGGSRYLGWYPSLFYLERKDSGKQDHTVADVHTDIPSIEHGDRGGILHLGVGDVNFGYFVVDKTMYSGPVFSHYEFVTPVNERLTDSEFSERLGELKAPHWTRESFLVVE